MENNDKQSFLSCVWSYPARLFYRVYHWFKGESFYTWSTTEDHVNDDETLDEPSVYQCYCYDDPNAWYLEMSGIVSGPYESRSAAVQEYKERVCLFPHYENIED